MYVTITHSAININLNFSGICTYNIKTILPAFEYATVSLVAASLTVNVPTVVPVYKVVNSKLISDIIHILTVNGYIPNLTKH